MKNHNKEIFIKSLVDGDSVEDIFLVKKKHKGVSRNGSAYLTLIITDNSGEMEAKIWENAEKYDENFNERDFVSLKGRVTKYQGKLQLTVHDLFALDEDGICLADFMRSSKHSPKEMLGDLRDIYNKISNIRIRKLIFSFLDDEEFSKKLTNAPAATTVHHSYIGGLLEHVLSLSRLAVMVAEHYPALDKDLLLAGVFFHDIGKTKEISVNKTFSYSDEGKLLGHLAIGSEMVSEKAAALKDFPEKTLLLIKHMILSHHGHLEFGSPKLPQIPEALVLHLLDDMDAKINMISMLQNKTGDESWSEYSKFLSREFYKGRPEKDSSVEMTEKEPKKINIPKKKLKKSNKKASSGELDLFD